MNILLTGGAGYIGSHTAAVLSQRGYRIVLLDNLSNSSNVVVENLAKITGGIFPFVKGDIRDTALLEETLRSEKINAVIHFAGVKAVGESVEKPIDYYANNVQGTISLLQAMNACKVTRLVFSSSATIYGQPHYLPLDEKHPRGATNPYGRCKLHIEEMLQDLATADRGWRIICLRYFNPAGAHESGLLGENPRGIPNNLMPYLAQVASGIQPILNVFGNDYPTPDGSGVRDYVHVMDLAEGHAAALDFLDHSTGWHAVNLGTGKGVSVFEMINAFERASGRCIPYRITARRAGDVAACYANPQLAHEILHWAASRTLEDICASAWRTVSFGG